MDSTTLTIIGAVKAGSTLAPNPVNIATIDLSAPGLQIGTAAGAGIVNAGTVFLSVGGAITEPNGSIGANSFAVNTSGDILLTGSGNAIVASTGIIAGAGDVVLVDDRALVLTGNYSGNNLFFEVNLPGGSLTLGGTTPAILTSTSGLPGRISLIADNITAGNAASSISAPGGMIELAPFSSINESVAGSSGAGQLLIDTTLLSIISGGSNEPGLRLGGFTMRPLAGRWWRPRPAVSRSTVQST